MTERDFQSEFKRKIKFSPPGTCAFEFKVAKTSLPFDSVQPHQIQALLHVKHSELYWKIPDAGYQNPFDAFVLRNAHAYVVVRYSSKNWYCIDIDEFVKERDISFSKKPHPKKSLTEDRAKLIAYWAYMGSRDLSTSSPTAREL